MKKIAILSLAVATLFACTKNEVIDAPKGVEISFDNIFVNNATKANDLTADNLQDFGVYGFVEANNTQGQIFTNQKVEKSGTLYTYSPKQYWIAGAQYYFSAIAPFSNAAWTYNTTDAQNGTIAFNNQTAGANQDLLFAYNKPNPTPATITSQPDAVGFAFGHMLSRVRFSFTNDFAEGSNIELKVTDVKITDAYKTGTLAVTDGTVAQDWTPADNTLEVVFGNVGAGNIAENGGSASTEHFYLIPAKSATYSIQFTVELFQAGVSVDTYNRTATVTLDMTRGYSYDLKAALNASNTSDDGQLYPIEFTVSSVENWKPDADSFTDIDATVITGSNN